MKKQYFLFNVAVNVMICLVLIVVAFVGIGNASIATSLDNKAIYRGNEKEPNVSLMFNVYWGTEYIEPILKVLEKKGVKTTFFIGGSWATKNNVLLKKIYENGHEIGSHGYSHKDAEKLSYKQNIDEIKMADSTIKSIIGIEPKLFAPPSGSIGSDMFKACNELNKKVIMWSRDTIDWRDKDSSLVLKRATLDIQNGELILLHPTEHTLKALPIIIDTLQNQKYQITTVSKCIEESAL